MPDFEKLNSGLKNIKIIYDGLCTKEPSTGIRRVLSLLFSVDFVPGDEGKERYKRFCAIVDSEDKTIEWKLAQLCEFYLREKHTSRLVLWLRGLLFNVFGISCDFCGVSSIHADAMSAENAITRVEDAMRRYIQSFRQGTQLKTICTLVK